MAMSTEHRNRLKANSVPLVKHMKIDAPLFLATFMNGDVLKESHIEIIKAEKTTQARAAKLLSMLPCHGGRAFSRLLEALKTVNQEDLIELLCPPTRDIENKAAIEEIIRLIDTSPKDFCVIPMIDDEKRNRTDLTSEGKIYPVPHSDPHGRAVIVKCGPETDITTEDGELLNKLFTGLHYETVEYSCTRADDLFLKLTKERENLNKPDSEFESFILFLLGSCSDGGHNMEKITSLFDGDKCHKLDKMPKLFFISNEETKPVQVSDETDARNNPTHAATVTQSGTVPTADIKADQLIIRFNASSPIGGRFKGSTFITSLAHSFAKHSRESSLDALLRQVISIGNHLKAASRTPQTQLKYSIDLHKSTLRHDFYFNPKMAELTSTPRYFNP